MKLICSGCGRDLNEIWQDNMSPTLGVVLCEDCSGFTARKQKEQQYAREYQEYCERAYEAYMRSQEEERQ